MTINTEKKWLFCESCLHKMGFNTISGKCFTGRYAAVYIKTIGILETLPNEETMKRF